MFVLVVGEWLIVVVRGIGELIVEGFGVMGMFVVEFFEIDDECIFVNEFVMWLYNSGYWS